MELRAKAYTQALEQLQDIPGWDDLNEDQRQLISQPLASRASTKVEDGTGIPLLRADLDAAQNRLNKAIEDMMQILDGQRVTQVKAASFFKGGIDTVEQLDAALKGLREECEHLIGEGKKVLIQ